MIHFKRLFPAPLRGGDFGDGEKRVSRPLSVGGVLDDRPHQLFAFAAARGVFEKQHSELKSGEPAHRRALRPGVSEPQRVDVAEIGARRGESALARVGHGDHFAPDLFRSRPVAGFEQHIRLEHFRIGVGARGRRFLQDFQRLEIIPGGGRAVVIVHRPDRVRPAGKRPGQSLPIAFPGVTFENKASGILAAISGGMLTGD